MNINVRKFLSFSLLVALCSGFNSVSYGGNIVADSVEVVTSISDNPYGSIEVMNGGSVKNNLDIDAS